MAIKVGINGFGRIGRMFYRAALAKQDLDIVAVNDITDAPTLAHLLKYDSIHGTLRREVKAEGNSVFIDGKPLQVIAELDPAKLPWRNLGVQVVVESTGLFTARDKAALHLQAGARKVVISAPAENADVTVCLGVNEKAYDPGKHDVISNASCTTNCLAPVAKVLLENFGIVYGLMTTVHAYTSDQKTQDSPPTGRHRDLRAARAAALSMIPASTGAARAIGLVLPELNGKLDGIAVRVPTANVSLVDLTVVIARDADVGTINATMKQAAEGPLKGILQYCEVPLVSADFNGNPHSSILDAPLTRVIDKRLVKVFSWYDNEWGYSNRLADITAYVAAKL